MLRSTLLLLTAIYITTGDTYCVYERINRQSAVCESDTIYTGIYTDGSYAELERKTVPQDIYITYLTQGSPFPSDFITLCTIKDRLPLIVFRPTDYSIEYINELASRLAQYNKPMLLQLDGSLSDKFRDFFRSTSDTIHLKAPEVAMVWGISDSRVQGISQLYPGDSYVDWVALNIFEGADRNGILTDPYPLYHTLSYFEKSKPVMINLSVASYTEDGHKYFAYEAAEEIKRIYSMAQQSSAIKAVNYISRTTPRGNAQLTNSEAVIRAFSIGCRDCGHTDNIRIPIIAYRYGDSLYCEQGIIPTEEEYCIINNKRCYKISNAGRYIFAAAG